MSSIQLRGECSNWIVSREMRSMETSAFKKKRRKACVKVGIKKKRIKKKRQREEKGEREKGGKKKVKGSNSGERLLERENYSSY